MSLYKQGVILYISKKKISVYIPYIYTHTYIYVKQQDCVCGHCVRFAHTTALLVHLVGIEVPLIRNWSAVENLDKLTVRGRKETQGPFTRMSKVYLSNLSTREVLHWKCALMRYWFRGREEAVCGETG